MTLRYRFSLFVLFAVRVCRAAMRDHFGREVVESGQAVAIQAVAAGHLLRRKFFPLQIKAGVCDPVIEDGEPKLDGKGQPVTEARYGFHALRHAAASAWIKMRIDLKRLQVWIGHESICDFHLKCELADWG